MTYVLGFDYEFRGLKRFDPDTVLLSQGGAYDHAYRKTYEVLFKKIRCPYFIIAHSYNDSGFLSREVRLRSSSILTSARRVFIRCRGSTKGD